jgi:hypothetical protein
MGPQIPSPADDGKVVLDEALSLEPEQVAEPLPVAD